MPDHHHDRAFAGLPRKREIITRSLNPLPAPSLPLLRHPFCLSGNHDQLFDLLIVITTCSSHNIPDFADFLARSLASLFGIPSVCHLHSRLELRLLLMLWRLCCFDLGSASALRGLVYHVAATSAPQNNNNNNSSNGGSSNGVFGVFGAGLLCSQRTDISLAQLDACLSPSLPVSQSVSLSGLWIISLI